MNTKVTYCFLLVFACIVMASLKVPDSTTNIQPYLNGIFSDTPPGEVGSWTAEDSFEKIKIASPLRILQFPQSDDVLVLSKLGEVWKVNLEEQKQALILDIKDRSFKLGEAGTVGMVLHPQFGNVDAPDKQIIFIFYRTKPKPDEWSELGFNRLSKFYWNEDSQTFDKHSEEVLFQQYDQSTWHNGGGMFFGPDGFLYLALGDEGADEHQKASTQRLNGGFFSGIIRIDVDNDPDKSHPIIRQPLANANPQQGWGKTYSQGYSIPNDNPWLSEDGSNLEEFFAIGIRSPYSTNYDKVSNEIWELDVGSDVKEEINIVKKGDNLQWPFKEGFSVSEVHEKPVEVIGNERPPIFEYNRSVGNAIIGGGVYRGTVFVKLYGKYLFADYGKNKLMALTYSQGTKAESEVLIPNLENLNIDLPEKPGVTGVHILENGEVLLTIIGEDHTQVGKILKLKQLEVKPDPPSRLSEIGAFSDLENLTVSEGIIPYTVNAPLWSDRAIKKRWMVIPDQQQIKFRNNGNWAFPEGTVFIKHFELPLSDDSESLTTKLETRFFIVGKNQQSYGLTYKWNDAGTDAELLRIQDSKEFDITENGNASFKQQWAYPSRDQCLTCHNKNANYVLGVKTHQLNGQLFYPDLGINKNQLEYLSEKGILNRNISDASLFNKAFHIEDETADLELRVRSYMDSNCAPCHQLGGISDVTMDLRYEIPLLFHNTINFPTQSSVSDPDHMLIKPGDHSQSEIWLRDSSEGDNRMPPLSRSLNDEVYLKYLAEWIDGLTDEVTKSNEFFLFPNPGNGWFYLKFPDNWALPTAIELYNMNGVLIKSLQTETNTLYLDLTSFQAGMYFFIAQSNGEILRQKLVIW